MQVKSLLHDNVVGLYGDTAEFSSEYLVGNDFLYRKKILLFVLCSPSAFLSLCSGWTSEKFMSGNFDVMANVSF